MKNLAIIITDEPAEVLDEALKPLQLSGKATFMFFPIDKSILVNPVWWEHMTKMISKHL